MAHFVVFSVEVARVAQLHALHNSGQRHSPGLQQHVDVVAHEDIRIHLKTIPLSIALQRLQVVLSVGERVGDRAKS